MGNTCVIMEPGTFPVNLPDRLYRKVFGIIWNRCQATANKLVIDNAPERKLWFAEDDHAGFWRQFQDSFGKALK